MFVGIFIEGVEQGLPFGIEQGFFMQQHADGFEGFSFAAAEQLGPVETNQAVLGVFAAVDQQPLVRTGKNHPTRRQGLAKHCAGEQLLPVILIAVACAFAGIGMVLRQAFKLGAVQR